MNHPGSRSRAGCDSKTQINPRPKNNGKGPFVFSSSCLHVFVVFFLPLPGSPNYRAERLHSKSGSRRGTFLAPKRRTLNRALTALPLPLTRKRKRHNLKGAFWGMIIGYYAFCHQEQTP